MVGVKQCPLSVKPVFNQKLYEQNNSIASTWSYVYYIINAYI